MSIEQHYAPGELAELLRVSTETLRRLAAAGELRSVRVDSPGRRRGTPPEGDGAIRRLIVTLTIAIAVMTFISIAPAANHKPVHIPGRKGDQSWQWNYRAWMPAHWIRLAQCESGSRGEPNWRHDSGTYQGAFGFYYGSWDSFKPVSWWPSSAARATPWQQYVVARRIAARYGLASPWGCWRGPQHAWVRGGLPEHGTYR